VRVPLVIVTGFLGAGKTTLVNHLLARRAARQETTTGKLGVIVNELGEVGIDGSLLAGDAARQVELPGGCVCCVLGDELETTLLELIDRTPGLEAIVLETTGVAEPLPIAWAVARAPVVDRVRLAAVVTLIDATHFLAAREVSASATAQAAYADVLLVTKASLVSPDEVTRVEHAVRALAPRALLRHGSTADHAAWLEALLADPQLEAAQDHAHVTDDAHGHVHTDDCQHLDSHAAHGIDSVWCPVDRAVDLEELEDQLADLPANYVRIKGIVPADDDAGARWMVVHRVGPRVSSEPVAIGLDGRVEQGRIVALGPGVARDELVACVERATPGIRLASSLV
jgi:G3E family GTPase